jgi:hypothetical protein
MNRETIKRLLVVSGLAVLFLFLAIGTALPLHAAPPTHTFTLSITQSPTATPSPTFPSSPWDSPLPSPTQLPSATLTLAEPPTSTPAPTQAPTNTLTLSPFDKAITLVTQNPFWVAGICLIPLLILGLLLILATLWRARPRSTPSPPPPVPTGPYLESTATPGGQGRLHLKPDGVTIGQTSENDLVITQDLPGWETVSRRHARIYAQSGRWIVEDLGSMNGIYVNGRRTGRNLLSDGWRLGVGGVEFVFHASTGEE